MHHPRILLLLGSLLCGLGFICLLPPFEGFDETAHFSYIQQIAQTRTWPRLNEPVSADVERYLDLGPSARSLNAKWTYATFFASGAATIAAASEDLETRERDQKWRAGSGNNWEAQHPPLYYTLLAPLYAASSTWSLKAQLALLRGASYALAWIGLVLIVLCDRANRARLDARWQEAGVFAFGAALWPALFPMWFPEMARLGNDSLVLLWTAAAVVVIRRLLESESLKHYLVLGVICGFGLLTKATMLPLCAAIGIALTVRLLLVRPWALRPALMRLCAFAGVAVLIAGWWYVRNLIDYGTLLGTNDEVGLARSGGLIKGLEANFSISDFGRGLALGIRTFFWNGTWSFVQPPRLLKQLLLAVAVMIVAGLVMSWRRSKPTPLDWIAILAATLFAGALIHHFLMFMASSANFEVDAWYLHSIALVLCGLVGKGLAECLARRQVAPIAMAALACPLLFLPFVVVMQAIYFSGCGQTVPDSPYFDLQTFSACGISTIWTNLSVLTYPALAACLFIPGWMAMLAGTFTLTRSISRERDVETVPVATLDDGGALHGRGLPR